MEKNILEINNKKLCSHCFSNITTDEPCEKCNNSSSAVGAIPEGTILHGKYIVGKAVYYDNSYYCYYAYDPDNDQRVLIRELFPAGGFCRRVGKNLVCDLNDSAMVMEFKTAVNNFHTAVKIMSGMKDTGSIMKVLDLFDENGTTYSVIQFPENALLLSEYIRSNGGKLDQKETCRIMQGIITALDTVHKGGIVHGNIRPENVVLIDKKILLTGMNYGELGYLDNRSSPVYTELNRFAPLEQLSKSDKRGPWTDIYALGTTVYYMLTGKYTENIFSRIEELSDESQKLSAIEKTPELPSRLIPILDKMLEVRIVDRYRNLYELSKDLRAANLVKVKIKPSKKENGSDKKGLMIVVSVILVILICGIVAFFAISRSSEKEDQPEQNISEDIPTDGETSESLTDDKAEDGDETNTEDIEGTESTEGSIGGIFDDNVSENEGSLTDGETDDNEQTDPTVSIALTWQSNTIAPFHDAENAAEVFGNEQYARDQITAVSVLDTLENAPEDAWDISEKQNGKVKAWVEVSDEEQTLYIAAEGGVNAEKACKDLFADYVNLVSVNFHGNFYTDTVSDMSGMFKNCTALSSIDLSSFNTKNVSDLSSMFEGCEDLTQVDISSFNTTHTENMSRMFYMCGSIETLSLKNFTTSDCKNMAEMFYGCSSLRELDIQFFKVQENTDVTDMLDGCTSLVSVNTDDPMINKAFDEKDS